MFPSIPCQSRNGLALLRHSLFAKRRTGHLYAAQTEDSVSRIPPFLPTVSIRCLNSPLTSRRPGIRPPPHKPPTPGTTHHTHHPTPLLRPPQRPPDSAHHGAPPSPWRDGRRCRRRDGCAQEPPAQHRLPPATHARLAMRADPQAHRHHLLHPRRHLPRLRRLADIPGTHGMLVSLLGPACSIDSKLDSRRFISFPCCAAQTAVMLTIASCRAA